MKLLHLQALPNSRLTKKRIKVEMLQVVPNGITEAVNASSWKTKFEAASRTF